MSIYVDEVKSEYGVWYKVFWSNGVYLGDFVQEVDGMYVFYHSEDKIEGAWSGHALRSLADKLYELNAPYQKHLENME